MVILFRRVNASTREVAQTFFARPTKSVQDLPDRVYERGSSDRLGHDSVNERHLGRADGLPREEEHPRLWCGGTQVWQQVEPPLTPKRLVQQDNIVSRR